MSSRSRLTLAFLQHDPASAARVLQELDLSAAADFLQTVPARLAAPVVNRMIPFAAARCLEGIAVHRAAAVLRELPGHDGTTLVRLLTETARHGVLAELPATMARRISSSLRYPAGAVGAWIDAQIPALRGDNLVKEALRFLRPGSSVSHVFLESADDGRYLGAISLVDLVGSRAEARLDELPQNRVAPLSNRATLAAVQRHPGWDEFLALPVIGRRGTVLGGLSRKALREGLHERHTTHARPDKPIAASLTSALLVTATGLARLALGRPETPPRMPEGEEHGR
jgi:Mg/Co/Ni transporter MgtE